MESPEKKEWYFAHAVNMYNEPIEAAFMKFLAHHLTNGDESAIENPNQPHHQEGYKEYAERFKHEPVGKGTRGMKYFHEVVLPSCKGCVAVPFLDGRLGLGAADEPRWYLERGMPALFVESTHAATPQDIKEFIENPIKSDLFRIRPFTDEETDMLFNVDPKTGNALVRSHEETRLCTWIVYNRVKRPYAEAHLVRLPLPEGFYPKD